METLEIQLIEAWLKKLRKHDVYNRKWWPSIAEAKAVMQICQNEDPAWFIEFGTGNGITASFVAAAGFQVLTFDPADRPKVYLDKTFPVKVYRRIDSVNDYGRDYRINEGKKVWFIDVGEGEKTIAKVNLFIANHSKRGDLIIERNDGITENRVCID